MTKLLGVQKTTQFNSFMTLAEEDASYNNFGSVRKILQVLVGIFWGSIGDFNGECTNLRRFGAVYPSINVKYRLVYRSTVDINAMHCDRKPGVRYFNCFRFERPSIPVDNAKNYFFSVLTVLDGVKRGSFIPKNERRLQALFGKLLEKNNSCDHSCCKCRPATGRTHPPLPPISVFGECVFSKIEKSIEWPSVRRHVNDNHKRSAARIEPIDGLHIQSPDFSNDLSIAFEMCKVVRDG